MKKSTVNAVELGTNTDRTKNIVLSVPNAPDGSFVITKGYLNDDGSVVGTAVLSSDVNGKLSFNSLYTPTWHTGLSYGGNGTQYTNNTGKVMLVALYGYSSGASGYYSTNITNGPSINTVVGASGVSDTHQFTVPVGESWTTTFTGILYQSSAAFY